LGFLALSAHCSPLVVLVLLCYIYLHLGFVLQNTLFLYLVAVVIWSVRIWFPVPRLLLRSPYFDVIAIAHLVAAWSFSVVLKQKMGVGS